MGDPRVEKSFDDWVEHTRLLAEEFFPGETGEPFYEIGDLPDEVVFKVIPITSHKSPFELSETYDRLVARFVAEVPDEMRDCLLIEMQVED